MYEVVMNPISINKTISKNKTMKDFFMRIIVDGFIILNNKNQNKEILLLE